MAVTVQVGGSLLPVSGIKAQVGGSLLTVSNGYAMVGGSLLQFYASVIFTENMTTGRDAGFDYNGFLDAGFAGPIGSMSSVAMPGATLRGLIADQDDTTVNVYIGVGSGPWTDPGASYIQSVKVGSFDTLTVGGANYGGTSYTAGAYRRWYWNVLQPWTNGQVYEVIIG